MFQVRRPRLSLHVYSCHTWTKSVLKAGAVKRVDVALKRIENKSKSEAGSQTCGRVLDHLVSSLSFSLCDRLRLLSTVSSEGAPPHRAVILIYTLTQTLL